MIALHQIEADGGVAGVKAIAEMTGFTESQISGAKNKCREKGWITDDRVPTLREGESVASPSSGPMASTPTRRKATND